MEEPSVKPQLLTGRKRVAHEAKNMEVQDLLLICVLSFQYRNCDMRNVYSIMSYI